MLKLKIRKLLLKKLSDKSRKERKLKLLKSKETKRQSTSKSKMPKKHKTKLLKKLKLNPKDPRRNDQLYLNISELIYSIFSFYFIYVIKIL
jgi:hypothetical protein